MSQEKVFQVRNNPNVQFWEVSQEEQEKLVNICGWQGRVLFTQPAAPAVTVDTPEFRDLLTTYWANNESQRKVIAKLLIDHIDAHAAAVAAKAVEKERTAKEHATQQAQQHAMEARTQRETVLSILRHFGLPENDWEALSLIKASAPQQHAQAALSDDLLNLPLEELLGRYWEIAYSEGKTGESRGTEAQHVLSSILATRQPAPESSQQAGGVVPDGWKLVPVEATEEMEIAGGRDQPICSTCGYDNGGGTPHITYAEMVAAAPCPPADAAPVDAKPVIDLPRLRDLVLEYGNRPVINSPRTRSDVWNDILLTIAAQPYTAQGDALNREAGYIKTWQERIDWHRGDAMPETAYELAMEEEITDLRAALAQRALNK